MEYRGYYRRNLPHWQPAGAWFFVTCKLKGALPRMMLEEIENRARRLRRRFDKNLSTQERDQRLETIRARLFERFLDTSEQGPRWLADHRIAAMVTRCLTFHQGTRYKLDEWAIMPNHLHLIVSPLPAPGSPRPRPLADVVGKIKSYTGHEANRILNRNGPFWQRESFDHWIRTEAEGHRLCQYIRRNPVTAGLCRTPEEWPWSSASRHQVPRTST